jgi:lambda repressor-like predicted transcriptional regulator
LKVSGQSLAGIAASLGVCRQAVSSALLTPSERIEQAIADALKIPVQTLFPERFDRSGVRIPRTRPDNISALPGAGDSQKHRSLQTQTERAA